MLSDADRDRSVARSRPDARRQAQRREAAGVVLLAWAVATAFGLFVSTATRVGPVVFRMSYNHGVHLGDVLAFVLAYATAGLITLREYVRRGG